MSRPTKKELERFYIGKLVEKCNNKPFGISDIEVNHMNADLILTALLSKLGFTELVDAYNAIEKLYA